MKKFNVNLFFYILSFYCFGAGIMDSFIIYDGWRYVGAEEFEHYAILVSTGHYSGSVGYHGTDIADCGLAFFHLYSNSYTTAARQR